MWYDDEKPEDYDRDAACFPPEEAKNCYWCNECVKCGSVMECLKLHFWFYADEIPKEKRCEKD